MSIEERAIAYRDDVRNGKHGTNNTITDAYYVGATEQHKIDIEKACEALYTLMDSGCCFIHDINKAKEIMKKAMEE